MGESVRFTNSGLNKYNIQYVFEFLVSELLIHFFKINLFVKQSLQKYKVIKSNNINVVFATTHKVAFPLLIFRSMNFGKNKLIITSVGLIEFLKDRNQKQINFYKSLIKNADSIICYSLYEKNELIDILNFNPNKIHFIPYYVDPNYFKPNLNLSPNPKMILSIGADSNRDFKLLIEVMKHFPELRLKIITYKQNFDDRLINDNVEILYNVKYSSLKIHYQSALFVVLPVKNNSYSGATTCLLQAMSMAKAVIVSKTFAISKGYYLKDNINVKFVRPNNKAELTSGIQLLLNNPILRESIGNRARHNVVKNLNNILFARKLLKIFNES